MTDRELLELAAKAAGIDVEVSRGRIVLRQSLSTERRIGSVWNPLIDDGDALRLAVKLHMHIQIDDEELGEVFVFCEAPGPFSEPSGADPDAATRRAIVRAAAALADTQDEQ
jgi:hypothetical protein